MGVLKRAGLSGRLFAFLLVALAVILAGSAVRSMVRYQYNGDELLHTQIAYLYGRGSLPFADVFSIYTPVFHWLILPTVAVVGTSLATLEALRWEMVLLFGLGVLFSFLAVRTLFSTPAAVLFVFLLLLDPFTTFAGAQIRPDTLMMLLFSAGVWAVAGVRNARAGRWYAGAGGLLGLSLLTAVKIAPAVAAVSVAAVWTARKRPGDLRRFVLWFFLPWIAFFAYCLVNGILSRALTQLIFDVKYLSDAILNPTRFGFFYRPDNVYVFGHMGKPFAWWYVRLLPLLACIGGTVALRYKRTPVHTGLVVAMLLTFLSLFIPTTAFIQYYVPSYWFFAVFGGVALAHLFASVPARYTSAAVIVSVAAGAVFIRSAIAGNVIRSGITGEETVRTLTAYWARIPSDAAVFPGFLFRPAVHPLIAGYYMGDLPPAVRNQFELPEIALERTKTPFVYLNDPALSTYEPSTQAYIRTRYARTDGDGQLRSRVE